MRQDEAEDLAVRILRGWPKMAIPVGEWERVLAPLDVGVAALTVGKLLEAHRFPPSIAEFLEQHRAIAPRADGRVPAHCELCGGDGMVTRAQEIHGHTYEVQTACRCSNGAGEVLAAIAGANDQERARLGVFRTPDHSGTFSRDDTNRTPTLRKRADIDGF